MSASPIEVTDRLDIRPGPALLRDVDALSSSLAAHRARHGTPRPFDVDALVAITRAAAIRGRGGAGFPFARKLQTTAEHRRVTRRPVVVVNASEGEPASAKDAALAEVAPHLVLDGAATAARALGAREVHVVEPGDRPRARALLTAAVAERDDPRLDWRIHAAAARFVAGQSQSVVELLAGRPGLPVTSWRPAAVHGHRGHPTLLSNAETWAHVGLLALEGLAPTLRRGTEAEPGTTLLTLHRAGSRPTVVEVEHGTALTDLGLGPGPLLMGGFHGTWVAPRDVGASRIATADLGRRGVALGAGVVIAPGDDACPVDLTVRIVEHLSAESAGRCAPCFNGLPALARALRGVAEAQPGARHEVERLTGLVTGRGACAHPDGTARLVGSLLTALPAEVAAHEHGRCLQPACSPLSTERAS